jgi:hypothetical protein
MRPTYCYREIVKVYSIFDITIAPCQSLQLACGLGKRLEKTLLTDPISIIQVPDGLSYQKEISYRQAYNYLPASDSLHKSLSQSS